MTVPKKGFGVKESKTGLRRVSKDRARGVTGLEG